MAFEHVGFLFLLKMEVLAKILDLGMVEAFSDHRLTITMIIKIGELMFECFVCNKNWNLLF